MILPKLFRRLAEYPTLDTTGGVDLAGSPRSWHEGGPVVHVPDRHATHLDTLMLVAGQHLRLTVPPERIVFIEG